MKLLNSILAIQRSTLFNKLIHVHKHTHIKYFIDEIIISEYPLKRLQFALYVRENQNLEKAQPYCWRANKRSSV